MNVSKVMTTDVISLETSDNVLQAAQKMRQFNIGCVLVTQDGKLVGIITDRDVIVRCVAEDLNPSACRLGDFMTKNPITIAPETTISEASSIMGNNRIRRLPVLSDGNLVGIVSLGDLAVDAAKEAKVEEALEEISVPTR